MAVETGQWRVTPLWMLPRRSLLLMLHQAGEIRKIHPAIRFKTLNPFVRRAYPRADADRHDADRQCTQETQANQTATGAANGRRATVQQSDGAASLLKVLNKQ